MRIYHTETQADYDALMEELGIKGIGTLGKRYWEVYENQTVVIVHALCRHSESTRTDTAYGSLEWALQNYPTVPIQKYKAKADEKMRFTKENIEGLVNKYFDDNVGECPGNLIAEIYAMDDTPEKVVVPKFVADYLEDCKKRNIKLVSALCPFKMGYGKEIELWFDNEDNNRLFALAWSNGYEVEKEPLYSVNINGQYLVKMIADRNVHKFVEEVKLCVWSKQAYQLTEAEIKAIDERYCAFAVPVQEVKNEL